MTTKRVETKVYTEHMYCECGGEMKMQETKFDDFQIQTSVLVWPPRYFHYCNKCGKDKALDYTYPRLVYEEVEVTE